MMMIMMMTMMTNTSKQMKISVRNAYITLRRKVLVLSCAKNIWIAVYSFSLLAVPTTLPAPTTTPKGKKDKTISKVAAMVMMMITIL